MKKIAYSKVAFCLVLATMIFFSTTIHAVTSRQDAGYYWDKTSIKCYFDPALSTTYGTGVYNAICFGILTWNSTEAPIAILSDDYTNWDVRISMEAYGNTGWNAKTYYSYYPDTLILDNNLIYINESGLEDYLSDTGLWRALGCHEMGHAHGVGHNTTTGENSIMKPNTVEFYDYRDGNPNLTAPQTPDITCINGIY